MELSVLSAAFVLHALSSLSLVQGSYAPWEIGVHRHLGQQDPEVAGQHETVAKADMKNRICSMEWKALHLDCFSRMLDPGQVWCLLLYSNGFEVVILGIPIFLKKGYKGSHKKEISRGKHASLTGKLDQSPP